MERVVFANSQAEVFAEYGLASFDDFFNYPDREQINENNKRDVSILTLGVGAGRRVFFMKRFLNPHFKDMAFTFCNFGRLCSQAACEWQNINLLLENGIETYRPACYGERTKCGMESKSFIITEKLQGKCLTDYVAENWLQLPQQQKEKIIISLAKAVRKIHDAAISLPDLYLWHVFIKESQNTGECEFAFIDLHRMKHNVTDNKQLLKNLGRLDHSMVDKYFDEPIRQLFIESYAGNDWPGDIASLAGKVKKYSTTVSSKRNPKPY